MVSLLCGNIKRKYSCNICCLRLPQSSINNIVSSSSDHTSTSSHHSFSFPPRTDMKSPDSTGFRKLIVVQYAWQYKQGRKRHPYRSLPKQLMPRLTKLLGCTLRKLGWGYHSLDQSCLELCFVGNSYLQKGSVWPFIFFLLIYFFVHCMQEILEFIDVRLLQLMLTKH